MSSVVGLTEGDGEANMDGLVEAAALFKGTALGAGVCARTFVPRNKAIRINDVNGCIGSWMPTL
jgi:hypothetical protein